MKLFDEEKLSAIIRENYAHNQRIGAGRRPRDRAQRDAELIYMHRHSGITVETLCMMLTDYEFAAKTRANG